MSDLASYAQPPLVEVALAVQFEQGTLNLLDVAAFYATIRSELPKYQEQPARPPMEEVFEPVIGGIRLPFEVMTTQPMPRVWFLSDDESRLVQLQHDLLAVNWRYVPDGSEYQRYRSLRADAERHLATLDASLREEGRKQRLRPNWCEVTYINHIEPDTPGGDRPRLDDVLSLVSLPRGEQFLPAPDDGLVRSRFVIPAVGGQPRGRLTIDAGSAIRNEDRVPIWVLTFAARVRAAGEGVKSGLEALDVGREWAVRAFEEVISLEMQSRWGRTEGRSTE